MDLGGRRPPKRGRSPSAPAPSLRRLKEENWAAPSLAVSVGVSREVKKIKKDEEKEKEDPGPVPRARKPFAVKINTKLRYLQGVDAAAEHLHINAINMKRIDERLLALRHLRVLDLSNNGLTNVDSLRTANSTMSSINLSKNKITRLDYRLKNAWQSVVELNLSENELVMLPESFVYLKRLRMLNVSKNRLVCLPFNLQLMHPHLQILLVSDNQLTFLPHPITSLFNLQHLDISGNPFHPADNPRRRLPGFGSINKNSRGLLTLLETCAKVVLNPIPRKGASKSPDTIFSTLKPGSIPATLEEYLYRGKRCVHCCAISTSYQFLEVKFNRSEVRTTQFTGSDRDVALRKAVCF